MGFTVSDDFIAERNRAGLEALEEDCSPGTEGRCHCQ